MCILSTKTSETDKRYSWNQLFTWIHASFNFLRLVCFICYAQSNTPSASCEQWCSTTEAVFLIRT